MIQVDTEISLTGVEQIQVCTFASCGRKYAIDIRCIREISQTIELTEVSHVSQAVAGLLNLRGQVFLALDLQAVLGHGPTARTSQARLILFKEQYALSLGILVDRVFDVCRIDQRTLAHPILSLPDSTETNGHELNRGGASIDQAMLHFISAIHREQHETTLILDVERLWNYYAERGI